MDPFVECRGDINATWELQLVWFLYLIVPPFVLALNDSQPVVYQGYKNILSSSDRCRVESSLHSTEI